MLTGSFIITPAILFFYMCLDCKISYTKVKFSIQPVFSSSNKPIFVVSKTTGFLGGGGIVCYHLICKMG